MQIILTGHHVDITEALRNFVHTKMGRLKRHFDNVVNVHTVLTVEKLNHKAEASVQLGGAHIFADAVATDMYAAIDALIDKLDRQILKHKEKVTDHHRSEGPIHRSLTEEED